MLALPPWARHWPKPGELLQDYIDRVICRRPGFSMLGAEPYAMLCPGCAGYGAFHNYGLRCARRETA